MIPRSGRGEKESRNAPNIITEVSHKNSWPENFQFDGFALFTEPATPLLAPRSWRPFTAYLTGGRMKIARPARCSPPGLTIFPSRVGEFVQERPGSPARETLIPRYDPLRRNSQIYGRPSAIHGYQPSIAGFSTDYCSLVIWGVCLVNLG